MHDGEHRILRCNSAYAAKAGMPMSEIIGKPYWRVFPVLDAPPPPCRVDDPLEGSEAPTVLAATGEVFAVHEVAAPCPAGNFWYCRHLLEDVTARKKLENELARERAILDTIIESAPNAFFMLDQDARLVRWNSYVRERLGLSNEQLRGVSGLSLVYEEDRAAASAKILTTLATGASSMELRAAGDADGPSHFLTSCRRLVIDDVPFVTGFCVDITARKRAEQALQEQKAFHDALVENIPGVFCVLDTEGNYLRWNSNLNRLTGLDNRQLYRRSSLLTIAEEDRAEAARQLQETFERGYVKTVLHVISKDRGIRAFLMTGRRFEVNKTPYLVGVGIDTTDHIAAMSALEHEARTDALTQIANRAHFIRRAVDEFARCRRFGHPLSIWILDLDFFKSVNDKHGHQAGDTVLQAFVTMGQQVLRDWDVIGRMGGEEFGVLLPETGTEQALLVAERLRQKVASTPVAVSSDTSITVTVSIGMAAMSADDGDVHALLGKADKALYDAKNTGRDKVCVAPAENESLP